MHLGLLISGNLGLVVFKQLIKKHEVSFVLTDKKSHSIIEFCELQGISFFAGKPGNEDVIGKLNYPPCDLILSINYLFIINKNIINYPKKGAINFHGSLLPKYRGRTPHVWAIINNETETGITAHLIDEGCDTGDVITQVRVPIESHHTGNDILNIYNSIYPDLVNEVILSVENGTIKFAKQDHSRATYYGKRVPEDGLINWDWQKERINNWVRAQAKPYPGAFSLIGNEKIIINKIEFSVFGFNYEVENGKVTAFEDGLPIVKTPNGCIRILDYEFSGSIKLNDILK